MKKIGILSILLMLILTGCDSNKTYRVSFNTDGGNYIEDEIITSGNYAIKPTDPVKEGYNFNNWQLDGQDYDFKSIINHDLTLTAKWEPQVITVTFDTAGGNEIENAILNPGEAINLPIPVKDHYKFEGWFSEGQEINNDTVINESLILTAKWLDEEVEVHEYTVTFIVNGVDNKTIKVLSGSKVSSYDLIIEGQTLLGWYNGNEIWNFDNPVTTDLLLTAKLSSIEHATEDRINEIKSIMKQVEIGNDNLPSEMLGCTITWHDLSLVSSVIHQTSDTYVNLHTTITCNEVSKEHTVIGIIKSSLYSYEIVEKNNDKYIVVYDENKKKVTDDTYLYKDDNLCHLKYDVNGLIVNDDTKCLLENNGFKLRLADDYYISYVVSLVE